MPDKSQLEKDIEKHEMVRPPVSIFVLIAVLLLFLGVLGVYSFNLRQELRANRQETAKMKSSFEEKGTELLGRIKMLEKENEVLKFNMKPGTEKNRQKQ